MKTMSINLSVVAIVLKSSPNLVYIDQLNDKKKHWIAELSS